jgi:hypothetical protein
VSEAGGDDSRGLLRVVVGDGVPLLLIGAGSLVMAGGLAVFLALTGEFLPHDIRYVGMNAADLCSVADCRVVEFMVHDRAAFGGALIAVGILYTYVVVFPLRRGEAWAWWLLMCSLGAGFGSFLAYLGYGYLDTWHGLGTLLLIPVFVAGLIRARSLIRHQSVPTLSLRSSSLRDRLRDLTSADGIGRACLLAGAAGVAIGGLVILRIGVSGVFVPEDLAFMGVTPDQLRSLNPRLVPLIAHDRAGFGGAVFTTGLTALGCVWFSRTNRALWESMLLAGVASLTTAIGIHLHVGYVNAWHLAPPIAAAASLLAGLALTFTTAYRTNEALTADNPTAPQSATPTSSDPQQARRSPQD